MNDDQSILPAQAITTGDITIHQDDRGLYSLRDLHAASGGRSNHRPSLWLRTQRTKSLIAALEKAHSCAFSSTQKSGSFVCLEKDHIWSFSSTQKSGSFVCKKLVYDYAMWISPEFNIHVIRTYDAVVTSKLAEDTAQAYEQRQYWFNRYPVHGLIYNPFLLGKDNREIADTLKIKIARVSRAIRSMVKKAIISPMLLNRIRPNGIQYRNLEKQGIPQNYGRPEISNQLVLFNEVSA